MAWLRRTANAKIHSATKKIPYQEWLIEKTYLKPILDSFKPEKALNESDVRKDNTIIYKNNFYRVPLGTYKHPKTIVRTEVTDDNHLIIYNTDNNKIASHKIYPGKGKTIGGSNYKRDFSSGIDQMIDELSSRFKDPVKVKEYLLNVRNDKPRYVRDQLQHIKKLTGSFDMKIMNRAMEFCIENKIYRATDLESVAKNIFSQESQEATTQQPLVIRTLNQTSYKIVPNKSDISDYQSLMN